MLASSGKFHNCSSLQPGTCGRVGLAVGSEHDADDQQYDGQRQQTWDTSYCYVHVDSWTTCLIGGA